MAPTRPLTPTTTASPTQSADGSSPYNATVIGIERLHDALMILRVRPDVELAPFRAGQYTALGLLSSEPRCDVDGPAEPTGRPRLIKRAYSICSPILDERGAPIAPAASTSWEFYVARVDRLEDDPAMLTPRLFALEVGARLFMGTRAKGKYTLEGVGPDDDVYLFGTGTGEAPHNAMVAELETHRLEGTYRGRIVHAICARRHIDLAYLETHRRLEAIDPNYRYLTLTTREPENRDPDHPGYVGRHYLQEYVASGRLEEAIGRPIDPSRSHAFLCGNPAMIGRPTRNAEGAWSFPEPTGLTGILQSRGFRPDLPKWDDPSGPPNLHLEAYW